MSKYTTSLYQIIKNVTPDNLPIRERINLSRNFFFDFDYPFYTNDTAIKKDFENKFITHYFNKEIGLETVELWKLYLGERLTLLMPYYKELYKTIFDYDIFDTTDIIENYGSNEKTDENDNIKNDSNKNDESTHINSKNENTTLDSTKDINENLSGENTKTNSSTDKKTGTEKTDRTDKLSGKSDSTVTENTQQLQSDFPQATWNNNVDYGSGMVRNIGTTGTVSNNSSENILTSTTTYNTTVANSGEEKNNSTNKNIISEKDKNTGTNVINENNKSNSKYTENSESTIVKGVNKDATYTKKIKGNSGVSKSQLIEEKRKLILNIDREIIEKCYDLFMLLY